MANCSLTFGQLLKKVRLEETCVGLRAFADLIEMAPSNLSNIERGRTLPPADGERISQICDALGLSKTDERRAQFYDLAAEHNNRVPADIAETIKKKPGVPVLVRTVANKRISEKKLRELAEYIKDYY